MQLFLRAIFRHQVMLAIIWRYSIYKLEVIMGLPQKLTTTEVAFCRSICKKAKIPFWFVYTISLKLRHRLPKIFL